MLNYDRKKLGTVLKKAREKKSLTQAEVAKKLGYSTAQFVSNIERGTCIVPLEILSIMVRMYGMKPNYIVKLISDSQEDFLRGKLAA